MKTMLMILAMSAMAMAQTASTDATTTKSDHKAKHAKIFAINLGQAIQSVRLLPNMAGKSRQGLTVRTIHSTASKNRRLFLPLRPGLQACPDNAVPSLPIGRAGRRSHSM